MNYIQVCEKCGSTEVARCKWVNPNNNHIYQDVDSGTNLDWCMECKNETKIIGKEIEDGTDTENNTRIMASLLTGTI